MTADRKLLRGLNVVPGRDELKRLVAEAMQQGAASMTSSTLRSGLSGLSPSRTLEAALSRHHRPRAGDLDCLRRRACPHRDGRDEPGHDVEGTGEDPSATLCSHFVLDNSPNLGYTLASDLLLTRGALARRRSVGAGTVP